MSNIWIDPFGFKLIKKNQPPSNPPPPPPPAPAPVEEPKVHYYSYYTMPCYQMQMSYTQIAYTQIMTPQFWLQAHPSRLMPAAKCHCHDKKPEKKKEEKKEEKKPVDEKKKKQEEAQKKKEAALAKEKADRENVHPTFANPRKPRKGVFER